jgi:hypothetical protein
MAFKESLNDGDRIMATFMDDLIQARAQYHNRLAKVIVDTKDADKYKKMILELYNVDMSKLRDIGNAFRTGPPMPNTQLDKIMEELFIISGNSNKMSDYLQYLQKCCAIDSLAWVQGYILDAQNLAAEVKRQLHDARNRFLSELIEDEVCVHTIFINYAYEVAYKHSFFLDPMQTVLREKIRGCVLMWTPSLWTVCARN